MKSSIKKYMIGGKSRECRVYEAERLWKFIPWPLQGTLMLFWQIMRYPFQKPHYIVIVPPKEFQ